MKGLTAVAVVLLIAANLRGGTGYFDPSTQPAPAVRIPHLHRYRQPLSPELNTRTLAKALSETKSFCWSISAPFYYSFRDRRAARKGPFRFRGGTLPELARAIRAIGLFADIKYGNTLVVASSKRISLPLRRLSPRERKKLLRKARSLPGVRHVSIRGSRAPRLIARVSPSGDTAVRHLVAGSAGHETRSYAAVPRAGRLMDILHSLYPSSEIPVFAGYDMKVRTGGKRIKNIYSLNRLLTKRYRVFLERVDDFEEGDDVVRFRLTKYRPITLNRPYTVSDVVHEIAKRTGGKFLVFDDRNVPVNDHVRIRNLEDLNKYLKDTTGSSAGVKRIH